MTKKEGCIVIIGIILIFSRISFASNINDNLRIVNKFPTEKQRDKYNYVLDRGHFDWDNETIYFCSQFQHRIFLLDLNGNLINAIGRKGKGPGEFNLPYLPFCYNDELYITDNFNGRIQIFTANGRFVREIKLADTLGGLVIINNKIVLYKSTHRIPEKEKDGKYSLLGIYNMSGELERDIYTSFTSRYNDYDKDCSITIRAANNQIHCLQQFGTTYRIFDMNGRVVKDINLDYDPLQDSDHIKTGYYYTYKTFCTYDDKIIAPVDLFGKICVCVFNMKGELIKKYLSSQEEKDKVYDIMDLRIRKSRNRAYLYLFVCRPRDMFYVAEIE